MEQPSPASRSASSCPLCGESNDCALALAGGRVDDCWCVAERFPRALLDSVSEADRGRCICRGCLARAADAARAALPNIAELLGPVLLRVAPEERPLLLALAERLAADRYRAWADEVGEDEPRAVLLGCAEREEEIARRVEGLVPDAEAVQGRIRARLPDVDELSDSLFAGRPLADQFAIQAQGERAGAGAWRAFAAEQADARARDVFLGCAPLEEENAAALESLLSRKPLSSRKR